MPSGQEREELGPFQSRIVPPDVARALGITPPEPKPRLAVPWDEHDAVIRGYEATLRRFRNERDRARAAIHDLIPWVSLPEYDHPGRGKAEAAVVEATRCVKGDSE